MRLANRPCEQCGKDTLHKGIVCTECNSIRQVPRRLTDILHTRYKRAAGCGYNPRAVYASDILNAAKAAKLAKGDNRGEKDFHPRGANVVRHRR
jgi:hypothetical protein